MKRPFSIYCDWAMHDELGDDVRLTEELTMRALDALQHWKNAFGVGFDCYLIDCFWFDQPGDYTRFAPETWPNGFEPARRRMEELGMTPGLWLDATGAAVAGWRPWEEDEDFHGWEPWQKSLDARSGWNYCLFDGPYREGLLSAMRHAVEEWGVGLFKFDFADFFAVSSRFSHLDAGEVYRRNVRAFKEALIELRRDHPRVIFLGYNGFAHVPDYIGSTSGPMVPGIAPHWLEALDYLYSGDPRPADVPCTSLRRAVDLYQDHMVYKFYRSGIPLRRIDDHGCMVGGTNTNYYLGKHGWRRAWVQSLARGGRKAHFYGDVTLLDDGDVEFLDAAREPFFDLYGRGCPTRPVGGIPCWDGWHGFLTGSGDDGLLVVANSLGEPVEITLALDDLQEARVLFHDAGFAPEAGVSAGALSVRLAAEQMALLGLGAKAAEEWVLGTEQSDPVTADARPLDLPFEGEHGVSQCRTSGNWIRGAAGDGDWDRLRLSFSLRDKGKAYRSAVEGERPVADSLGIDLQADGAPVPAERVVPNVRVWSGCSWATALYRLAPLLEADSVAIRFTCPESAPTIIPRAWLQRAVQPVQSRRVRG